MNAEERAGNMLNDRISSLRMMLKSLETRIPKISLHRIDGFFPSLETSMQTNIESNFNDLQTCISCKILFPGRVSSEENDGDPGVDERRQIYRCETCGKSSFKFESLEIHEIFHGKKKSYSCDLCPRNFGRACDFSRHMSSVHQKARPFKCCVCSEEFYRNKELVDHIRSQEIVKFGFFRVRLRNHKKVNSNAKKKKSRDCSNVASPKDSENASFLCSVCKKGFGTEELLGSHERSVHSASTCAKCNKPHSTKNCLTGDSQLHACENTSIKEEPQNDSESRSVGNATSNLLQQGNEEIYRCFQCKAFFMFRSSFEKHLLIHIMEKTGFFS